LVLLLVRVTHILATIRDGMVEKNDEQKIPHFYLEMTQIGEMRCEENKQLCSTL
jgi:hypothetical protein